MAYKEFNWDTQHDHGEFFNSWLNSFHEADITEEEFVKVYQLGVVREQCQGKKAHTPSRAKSSYRYLKSHFGFFGGV